MSVANNMAHAALTALTPAPPLRHAAREADSVLRKEKLQQMQKGLVTVGVRRRFILGRKIKAAERMLLMDNLSTMLGAGLPITDALTILSEEIKKKQLKRVLLEARHSVEIGKSFSDGLKQYPTIFPPLLTATIRVGEISGTLVEVLARLAEMARRESQLKRKVIGALMYPTVVVIAMIVVAIIMITYVFPQIISIFVESNIKLPPQILFLDWLGKVLASYGFFILGGLVLLFISIYFLLKQRTVRKAFHGFLLRLPLIGQQIIKGSVIARIALNLRTMLASGLPIVEAVKTIAGTISNLAYKDALNQIANEIEVGRSVHDSLASRPQLFPPIVIRMVKVGEGTGRLVDILQKLGNYYEEKVDDILGNLSTILEPVLLLIVGVVVGFLAVSIIGPIYELASHI